MTYEQTGSLAVRFEDGGQIIWARPRPEDEGQLVQLMGGGPIAVSLRTGETDVDADTQGHSLSTEVTVDVEGHALTLRLPSPADAAALRNRLATGVLVATLVAAGAGAGAAIQGMSEPAVNTTVAPHVAPAQASDLELRREARLAEMMEVPPFVAPAPAEQAPVAPAAPAIPAQESQTSAAERDLGIADQAAQRAAEDFARSAGAGSQTDTGAGSSTRHAGGSGPLEFDR